MAFLAGYGEAGHPSPGAAMLRREVAVSGVKKLGCSGLRALARRCGGLGPVGLRPMCLGTIWFLCDVLLTVTKEPTIQFLKNSYWEGFDKPIFEN